MLSPPSSAALTSHIRWRFQSNSLNFSHIGYGVGTVRVNKEQVGYIPLPDLLIELVYRARAITGVGFAKPDRAVFECQRIMANDCAWKSIGLV